MMVLDHLEVVSVARDAGGLGQQPGEQKDAEAHVGRVKDGSVAGPLFEHRPLRGTQSGGTGDERGASAPDQAAEILERLRGRKVDHHVASRGQDGLSAWPAVILVYDGENLELRSGRIPHGPAHAAAAPEQNQPRHSRPAVLMEASSPPRRSCLMGVSGSLSSFSMIPIIARAHFTGIGFDSTNRAPISG